MNWTREGDTFVFFDDSGKPFANPQNVEVLADQFLNLWRYNQILKIMRQLPLEEDPTEEDARKAHAANNAWLVSLAYKHDEIGVSAAAQLLGTDIVSAREILKNQLGDDYQG